MAAGPPKYSDLKAMLAAGKPLSPVIVLAGPEPFFKEEALGLLSAALEKRSGGEMNRVSLDAASIELESLLATHLTPSLFGGEKLVILRGFDRARAAERKSFLASIAGCHFPSSMHLILLSEEARGTPLELKGQDVLTVMFYVPWQSDLLAWIGQQLMRFKVRYAREVPDLLYRMHGKAVPWKADLEVDLFRLSGSIERLGRHVAATGGTPVDRSVVTAVLGLGDPPDVFRIVDLVARRDPSALRQTRFFLEEVADSAVGLVALLLDRFEKLLGLRASLDLAPQEARDEASRHAAAFAKAARSDVRKNAQEGLGRALSGAGEAVSAALGDVKDFQRPSFVLQAERWQAGELALALCRLVELDRVLKSGAADERSQVELFVASVVG